MSSEFLDEEAEKAEEGLGDPTIEELMDEVDDLSATLNETEGQLEATEEELDRAREKIEQLEAEREAEGWEEWGEVVSEHLSKADLDKVVAQAHTAEDALVSVFRRGLVAGIQLMERYVRIHIEEGK